MFLFKTKPLSLFWWLLYMLLIRNRILICLSVCTWTVTPVKAGWLQVRNEVSSGYLLSISFFIYIMALKDCDLWQIFEVYGVLLRNQWNEVRRIHLKLVVSKMFPRKLNSTKVGHIQTVVTPTSPVMGGMEEHHGFTHGGLLEFMTCEKPQQQSCSVRPVRISFTLSVTERVCYD